MRVNLSDGSAVNVRPLGFSPPDRAIAREIARLETEPMAPEEFLSETRDLFARVLGRAGERRPRRAAGRASLGDWPRLAAALAGRLEG